jgi:hypothetical protein
MVRIIVCGVVAIFMGYWKIASAEPFLIDSQPAHAVWVNPGFYSMHFQKNAGLNDSNTGLGIEYRYSSVHALTAGFFNNSDWQTSHYLGWYWQPMAIGPIRLGAVFGALDGYPKMQNGGWFPAAIPAVSYEYRRVGANVLLIPGYKDRLYGSISIQLKFRVDEITE